MLYYLGKGTEFKKEDCKEYKTIEGVLKAAAKNEELVVWDENGNVIGSLTDNVPEGALETQPIICVFNRPDDYPDKCVARLFEGTAPTNIIITRNTVEEIREDITKCFPAMLPFGRNREDHKSVVESWI